MSVATGSDISRNEDFLRHPKGVFVCFFSEMWEPFSLANAWWLVLAYLLLEIDEMCLSRIVSCQR